MVNKRLQRAADRLRVKTDLLVQAAIIRFLESTKAEKIQAIERVSEIRRIAIRKQDS